MTTPQGGLPGMIQGGLNWLGQNVVHPVENTIAQVPQNIQNALNTQVPDFMVKNPLVPQGAQPAQGQNPTVGQYIGLPEIQNYISQTRAGLQSKDPMERLTTGMGLVSLGMGEPTKPEEDVAPELETGESLQRDMRYKQGTFVPKKGGKVQAPLTTQDTAAVDQYTTQPGEVKPPSTEQAPGWPEKPTQQTIPAKKPFKLPGTYDPIDNTQASSATQNSKAYSVTTPDIQDAYRRNGITDPSQVYPKKQALYDSIINPTLKTDTTQLPLGSVESKTDGIIPKIVTEIQKMNPAMTEQEAYTAAQPFVTRINALSQNEAGGTIRPSTIGLKNILDYRTDLNQSTAVKNLLNGNLPTNPFDTATVATRNVLSGLMNDYAPSGISQAVKDYGLLEEGFPSYLKAFNNPPPGITEKMPNMQILGTDIKPIAQLGGKILGSPAGRLIGTGVLGAGLATAGILGLPQLYNSLTHQNYSSANDGGQPSDKIMHISSVAQDVKTGHNQLPENPSITPLTPGTPEYTRANAAMTGNSRQFMANAPQYMESTNTVMDDVKGGMPLDILHNFKTAQDWQAYMSNPKSPYAQQVAHIGQLNSQYRAAWQQINGTPPDDNQLLSPGDSQQQFIEKYQQMVKFISDQYKQFQVPYLQTTEAVTSPNAAGGSTGGATQYGLPQQQGGLPAGMLQGNSQVPNFQYVNGQWVQQ